MNITRVTLDYNTKDDKKLIAIATVDFDYSFRIKDIKLKTGEKGAYLVFPQKLRSSGFIAYPTKDELRQEILHRILDKLGEEKQASSEVN